MNLPRKKILIVDDEEDLAGLIRTRLESHRFNVSTANDGDEGLSKVREIHPDLIILDIGMARTDGYSFVLELRKDPEHASIPIIVLTAKDKMQDLFKIEGVNDYMLKPFSSQELVQRVSELLREKVSLENTSSQEKSRTGKTRSES